MEKKMPQSLHSLLLAKNSSASNAAFDVIKISDQSTEISSPVEERKISEKSHSVPVVVEDELGGTSVMMYEDDIERLSKVPYVLDIEAADIYRTHSTEIAGDTGTLNMSLENSSKNYGEIQRLQLENESLRRQIIQEQQRNLNSHLISPELNAKTKDDLQRLELENESIKIQLSEEQQIVASTEKVLKECESKCSGLLFKVGELEQFKADSRKAKLEHDACLQRLSSENGHLKAAQRDIAAVNLSSEKKTAALETSRLALLEQVKLMEAQLSENAVSSRKTQESLMAAERQLSQLDSENTLLRQLRVDLDAASRDSGQLRRQVASLEAENSSLRNENSQLRQNLNGSSGSLANGISGHNGDSDSYSSSVRPLSGQSSNGKDRDWDRDPYGRYEISTDRDQRKSGYPPPVPSYHQEQQASVGRGGGRVPLSAYATPPSSQFRGDTDPENSRSQYNGEPAQNTWEADQRKGTGTGSVQSLADLMGGRRGSVHGNPSQRSSLNDILSPPITRDFPSSGSFEGERYRNDASTSDAYNLSPSLAPAAATVPSRRGSVQDGSNRRGSSSGGGVSTFYDDSAESSVPAARAPFGTDQTAAITMVSYEESDRRLTALMTEKSVLYEESARLQQRGGKILRERTRLQYVDARLVEVGKEIAIERKKLSGKPG